jgi:Na+-translocating ferredoxin:NAD+ oxidoreductase RnfD subunit
MEPKLRVLAVMRDQFMGLINIKYAPPFLISLILLIGHFTFGILEGYYPIIVAVSCGILTELILGKLVDGKWKNISSAYISGISVSILIRSTLLWPFALTAVISIMSKYVLRYKGRHLWNPSNFGISWILVFLPFSAAALGIQWGNNILPMLVIWTLGFFIVWRVKRLHITLTYVLSFLFFSVLRSLILGDSFFTEVSPITGPMYQLFIFFMITDPPTTVKNRNGQILVAFLVAFVEFILRLNQVIYAPFYSLFMVGPMAMIISLYLSKQKEAKSGELSVVK